MSFKYSPKELLNSEASLAYRSLSFIPRPPWVRSYPSLQPGPTSYHGEEEPGIREGRFCEIAMFSWKCWFRYKSTHPKTMFRLSTTSKISPIHYLSNRGWKQWNVDFFLTTDYRRTSCGWKYSRTHHCISKIICGFNICLPHSLRGAV